MRDAVNAYEGMPVVASGPSGSVVLTARNKGAFANEIDVRLNVNPGEALPAGIAMSAIPGTLSSGATNPTIGSTLWSAIGDEQYDVIVLPYTDATNLTAVDTELASRWGPIRQIDGLAISAKRDSQANLSTFGAAQNTKHIVVAGQNGALTPPYETAAALAALVGFHARNDPARPFRTLRLFGVAAPTPKDRFTFVERELLLRDGVSTLTYGPGGEAYIERLITMYQVNGAGAPDTAFLDAQTLLTLSYLRWDLRRRFQTRYPRHKIAGDTIRLASGQAIITPKVGRAEVVAAFQEWEALGLVEDLEQFKRDLVVEVSATDPTRMDFLLPINLVNPLHVIAQKIEFRL